MRRIFVIGGVTLALVTFAFNSPASAHPLGNFTINQYAGIVVFPQEIRVDYVVDMAEIPAFRERQSMDKDADGTVNDSESKQFAVSRCTALAQGFRVTADGRNVTLLSSDQVIAFPPGAAGLTTLRLECPLRARMQSPLRPGAALSLENRNYADRIGWREITAVGNHIDLRSSSVPERTTSERLTRYPKDLLQSPLDVRRADLTVEPGPGSISATNTQKRSSIRGVSTLDALTRSFTGLVARQKLTIPFALLAFVIAVGLGALHALAPGHGKTIMAAYAAGERSSMSDIMKIGMAVTVTHTIGVLILGIALSASALASPERVYPPLGIAGGLMIAAIGFRLLIKAIRKRRTTTAGAELDHAHAHDAHDAHDHHVPAVGKRGLFALGFAGGLVPSPSAVVVLLGAIALGRAWFGVVLVIAYGLGMAGTLSVAGLLLRRARGLLKERSYGHGFSRRLLVAAPFVTAVVLLAVGIGLLARNVAKLV